MEIENKKIALVSAYEASYGGNFIKMQMALASELEAKYGCKVYIILPWQTEKDWLSDLQLKFAVGFTNQPYNKSKKELINFFEQWHIDLVHTNFELYDIPVAKAIKRIGRDIKMVWHLRDNITLDKRGLSIPFIRKIKTHLGFWVQFGYWGNKAYFVPGNMEVGNIENHYRNHFFSFPNENLSVQELENVKLIRGEVVRNGLDLSRVPNYYPYKIFDGKVRFLTFGGHTMRKGIPTIFDAAEMLENKNIDFRLGVTLGVGTLDYVNHRYKDKIPVWLELIEQTDDISGLFSHFSCFISAAQKETFSNAVAEAAIYGLPVIQSNIIGTWWNSQNPSTFLFDVGDANDLARQMINVIQADKNELQLKCLQTSKNNRMVLSMDGWVNRIIEVYKNRV